MNDFIFTTEFLTEFSIPDIKNSSISAIILYEDNLRDIYKEDLMGKSSPELVKNSLKGLKIREVNVQKNDALIDIVKKNVENEDYVIVLYANTPLIREETISDALSYATTKSLDYCKLYHGAIFKVEAVKINRIEYISEANFLNKEDFLHSSPRQLNYANVRLKLRQSRQFRGQFFYHSRNRCAKEV